MRIEQYSHGKLSLIWVKHVSVTAETLHGLIRLMESNYIVATLTALDANSDLVRKVAETHSIIHYIAPEKEHITSDSVIAAKTEDILSLAGLLSSCDARCITFYGLDKELSPAECKALRSDRSDALVINGEVKYCTSVICDEHLVSIMLNRSGGDTKKIASKVKTLFKN